jgi:hypothetical protein
MSSSAVSDCQNTFIAKTPARIERFAFLRASPRWIPGAALWAEHRGGYGDRRTRRLWNS